MNYKTAAFAVGFFLDLLVGDPHWIYHPVRMIGALIQTLEKRLRSLFPSSAAGETAAGGVMAAVTVFLTGGVVWVLTAGADHVSLWAGFAVRTILTCMALASRSLRDEAMKVYRCLKTEDLVKARKAVSMIVGRDTDSLTGEGIAKAAVETVAENASDGVIAPLLFLALGGPAAGWIYKAVNTMDSMVGYKNERWLHFGRCAAKLDDLLNFLPSRISAAAMILCCPLLRLDMGNAYRIWKRDRYCHASPNSGQTESVMAGALHVRLAGDASYFGRLVHKPEIGDPDRPVQPEDIPRSCALMLLTGTFVFAVLFLVRLLCG